MRLSILFIALILVVGTCMGRELHLPPSFITTGSESDLGNFVEAKNGPAQLAFTSFGETKEVNFFQCDASTDALVSYTVLREGASTTSPCSLTFTPAGPHGFFPCDVKGAKVVGSCSQLFADSQTGWPAKSAGMQCMGGTEFSVNGDEWTWVSPQVGDCSEHATATLQARVQNSTGDVLPMRYDFSYTEMEPFAGCVPFTDETKYDRQEFDGPSPADFAEQLRKTCELTSSALPPMPQQSVGTSLFGLDKLQNIWQVSSTSAHEPRCISKASFGFDAKFAETIAERPGQLFLYGFGPCCNTNWVAWGTLDVSSGRILNELQTSSADLDSIGVRGDGTAFATTSPAGTGSAANKTVDLLQLTPSADGSQNYTRVARYTASQLGFESANSYFAPSLFFDDGKSLLTLIGHGALVRIDANNWQVLSVIKGLPYIDRISYSRKRDAFYGITFPQNSNLYGTKALGALSAITGKPLPVHGAFFFDDFDEQSCSLDDEAGLFTCAAWTSLCSIDVETTAIAVSAPSSASDQYGHPIIVAYSSFDARSSTCNL